MTNTNLHKARNAKNDEFYTRLEDINEEMNYYEDKFSDKVVFCNCDNPTWSAFWKYFHLNFSALGLKKLISTHYDKTEPTYKMEYEGGDDNDIEVGVKTPLEGNGDFRNQECLDLLDESDIVVTNPPFSLFREYMTVLMEHKKKFLIIGNQNALTYKEIFPLIKSGKCWWGAGDCIRWFLIPDFVDMKYKLNDYGERIAEGARSRWWTNLDHSKRHEKLILWKNYTPEEYPKYTSYDVIEVSKTNAIPVDYEGVMGVPITFMDKYNPDQFEIIGMAEDNGKGLSGIEAKWDGTNPHCIVNGKAQYKRIFIRKKERNGK